jgi:hypothetical protein
MRAGSAAAASALAFSRLRLHRWTGNSPEGAEHAAIARFWPQHHPAPGAFVKHPARIGRHRFDLAGAAKRASDCRLVGHSFTAVPPAVCRGLLNAKRDRAKRAWGDSVSGAQRGGAMIRFVLRFVGLLLLALGFIFLVHDGTKSIADQTLYLSTVGSTWANVHQTSLSGLQPLVERLVGHWFWQGMVQRYFLEQPVSLVLAIVGGILILLGRKKRPLIGYARD